MAKNDTLSQMQNFLSQGSVEIFRWSGKCVTMWQIYSE